MQDTAYQQNYTLIVTRQKSDDSTLASLAVGGGDLSPGLTLGTTAYSVTVPWECTETNVTVELCGRNSFGDIFCEERNYKPKPATRPISHE